jgi:hypothetical protein
MTMKKMLLYTAFACLLAACSKDKLTASGDKITETRQPGIFTGVNTSGSTTIHISYGSEHKVVLKGSSNLIPYYKTEIINGVLYLGYQKASVQHDDIEAFVTLPFLNIISLSGSSDVDIAGQFPIIETLKVSISGSGEVEANDPLTAKETNISISGSGEAALKKLGTKKADIDMSGSGSVKIGVEQHLKVRISGSGKVEYLGTPEIDSKISGSGKLTKL